MQATRWTGTLGGAMLLGAAIGVGLVAAGVGGESPQAAAARNEAGGHRGQHGRGCWACAASLDWMERNPGRRPGDLLDAADRGLEARPPGWPAAD